MPARFLETLQAPSGKEVPLEVQFHSQLNAPRVADDAVADAAKRVGGDKAGGADGKIKRWTIGQVVHVRAKFQIALLTKRKALAQSQTHGKEPGTAEEVSAGIALLTRRGSRELRPLRRAENKGRARFLDQLTHVRRTTVAVGRRLNCIAESERAREYRERSTAFPDERVCDLPAADDLIHNPARVASVLLAMAEGQLVNDVALDRMLPIKI